jgi:hypothetical protein
MRERCEDDLGFIERGILRSDKPHFRSTDAGVLATLLISSSKRQLERRMLGDKSTQLPARIPTGAEDTNRNFMHKECITLHWLRVNDPRARLAHSLLWC